VRVASKLNSFRESFIVNYRETQRTALFIVIIPSSAVYLPLAGNRLASVVLRQYFLLRIMTDERGLVVGAAVGRIAFAHWRAGPWLDLCFHNICVYDGQACHDTPGCGCMTASAMRCRLVHGDTLFVPLSKRCRHSTPTFNIFSKENSFMLWNGWEVCGEAATK